MMRHRLATGVLAASLAAAELSIGIQIPPGPCTNMVAF